MNELAEACAQCTEKHQHLLESNFWQEKGNPEAQLFLWPALMVVSNAVIADLKACLQTAFLKPSSTFAYILVY